MIAMDHAEPTAEVNVPQNEGIVATKSADDQLPRGKNKRRQKDTMIDDGGDVDDLVDQPDASPNADADSEDDNDSDADDVSAADASSAAADQAEQAGISTIAHKPVPVDVDGGSEADEQNAPSEGFEGSSPPAGGSQSADLSAEDDGGYDDDSQPVAGAAGSEASPEMDTLSADDGTESVNEDDDKMDSSVFSGSDVGKSEETASMDDDADKDEIISSERAALEDAYGPYIHPTDMCLDDARKRLRIAIEQTRILRESFTDQAYERFRVVMRPAPTSIDEIVDPIEEDPLAAVATLRENSQARQVEKDKELMQSQQTGIPLEELAYAGDGLDLVALPDDEMTDSEIDLEQYPENGPTDPETNQRREGFNSATVAAVEQLFERVKRGRLIREGKDIETVMAMARTVERTMSESFHPTTFARAQAPSPAPSEDSNAAGFGQQRVTRGLYSHLLTLNPEAEGDRASGRPTAARSALVSRGVGMSETKRDVRINPAYQRMFQPNYLLPPSTDKFLPPLVGPQQLSRLQAPNLLQIKTDTESEKPLQTIVTDLCGELGSSSGVSGISMLRKVRSTFPEKKESDSTFCEPSLLYSVMSAVGLITDRDNDRGSDVDSLGLSALAEIKTVSDFLHHDTSIGKGKKRSLGQTNLDLSSIESAKRPSLQDEQTKSPIHIRGGGNGDGGNEKQATGKANECGKNNHKDTVKTNDVQQTATSQPLLQYPVDANYKLYSAMAQSNSQNAMAAAAASSQLLQHQLGIGLQSDPYSAAMAANVPVGSAVGSLSASEMSEFYMRNGLGFAGTSAGLGLVPGPDAAVAARYQAALTMNVQNPFGYIGLSPMNAPVVNLGSKGQEAAKLSAKQRKRSSSFSQNQSDKKMKAQKTEQGNGIKISRPSSAPPSPTSAEMGNALQGMTSDDDSVHQLLVLPFTPPPPPELLPKKISNLALRAKFHDAMAVASDRDDDAEALLVDFLFSLGSAVPKLKSRVTDMLLEKLNSADKRTQVGILVGDSKFAHDAKEMIVAMISVWMCVEQSDLVNGILSAAENGSGQVHPELEWLTTSAIDESLKVIAPFLNSLSSASRGEQMKQVVLVVGKAITKEVFVSEIQNASLLMMDELMKLLDNLRSDALQAKTRERVLLAALVSRCSNMTEAFSNAYVSSIVRAGEALTHEDVCEIVQDTEVRASTMLPFDYFQDNAGVWEEPCRPEQGYHTGLCGVEMKKEAHARSLLRKSMKRLQDQLGLKGGILDGGPYYPVAPIIASTPTTPNGPSLMRSFSGSMKQKGASEYAPPDAAFNPGHFVPPMNWNINDVSNLPYGQYSNEPVQFSSVGDALSEDKRDEYSELNGEDLSISLAQKYRSTHEVKWDDVADMFLHGGNSRQIDINSVLSVDQGPLGADEQTGKKKIYAPFVQPFDLSSLEAMCRDQKDGDDDEKEDISDETILNAHQGVLDEMKLKLDAALEKRRQQTQQRGRKKSVG